MNKIIYTCITGSYDQLHQPLINNPDWKHVCYSNKSIHEGGEWEIRKISGSTAKDARKIKIVTPFDYDVSIWIDGNMKINCNLDKFVSQHLKTDFGLMTHGRDCIYDEAAECVLKNKDSREVIEKQMSRYLTEGYPKNNGLVATGIIIRQNNDKVKSFCKRWWREVEKGSRRDQLSFNYVMWEYAVDYNLFPFFPTVREQFIIQSHGQNTNNFILK
jgi:O-antigen biosynthesis protein